MQMKETETDIGRFTGSLVIKTVGFFPFFFFLSFQLQETQDQRTEAVRCAEKTQDHIQKYDVKQHRKQLKYRADKQYNMRIRSVMIIKKHHCEAGQHFSFELF